RGEQLPLGELGYCREGVGGAVVKEQRVVADEAGREDDIRDEAADLEFGLGPEERFGGPAENPGRVVGGEQESAAVIRADRARAGAGGLWVAVVVLKPAARARGGGSPGPPRAGLPPAAWDDRGGVRPPVDQVGRPRGPHLRRGEGGRARRPV